jgi:hypothetical protein
MLHFPVTSVTKWLHYCKTGNDFLFYLLDSFMWLYHLWLMMLVFLFCECNNNCRQSLSMLNLFFWNLCPFLEYVSSGCLVHILRCLGNGPYQYAMENAFTSFWLQRSLITQSLTRWVGIKFGNLLSKQMSSWHDVGQRTAIFCHLKYIVLICPKPDRSLKVPVKLV